MDCSEFFQKLPAMSTFDQQRVLHAYDLARLAHTNQFRDTGEAYLQHAIGVTLILLEYGYTDAHTLVLGLTHDVLENSFITLPFVENVLGHKIATDVSILSKSYHIEDPSIPFVKRKIRKPIQIYHAAIAESTEQVIVAKGSDRIHNLTSFPNAEDESSWPQERRVEQIQETRQYIIPAVERYNERMARKLTQLCMELELTAERIISSRPPPRNE